MVYSKYFGEQANKNGVPKYDLLQHQQIMNIVSLEGILEGVKKARRLPISPEANDALRVLQFECDINLAKLTRNIQPEKLFDIIMDSQPI